MHRAGTVVQPTAAQLLKASGAGAIAGTVAAIRCRSTPAGVGTGLRWAVTVNGLVSPASPQTTGYARPLVSSVSGPGARDARTRGGEIVYIRGANFGPGTCWVLLSRVGYHIFAGMPYFCA